MNRDQMRLNQTAPEVTAVTEGVILALWRQGLDTLAIAKHTHLPEWQVYNRLLHLRDRA